MVLSKKTRLIKMGVTTQLLSCCFVFVLVVVLVVKVVDQKFFGLKNYWVKKIVLKKFKAQKVWSKLGQ